MNLISQLEDNPMARLAIIAAIEIASGNVDGDHFAKYGAEAIKALFELAYALDNNDLALIAPKRYTNELIGLSPIMADINKRVRERKNKF